MRKATGKVVSLVLALALVVTSFSSTFAFAATKTETAKFVHAKDGTVYLANLSNYADSAAKLQAAKEKGLNLFNITKHVEGAWLETKDHIRVDSDIEISSVSVSGDNILRVTKLTESAASELGIDGYSKDDYVATVRDAKGTGTATVNVLYTGKTTQRGDDEITVRGSMKFTIKLLDAETPYLSTKTSEYKDGIAALQKNPQVVSAGAENPYATYAMKDSGSIQVPDYEKPVTTETAYVVIATTDSGASSAEAIYTAQDVVVKNDDLKNYADDKTVTINSNTYEDVYVIVTI